MSERTSDAAEILDLEFGADHEHQELLAEERLRSQAEKAVYSSGV